MRRSISICACSASARTASTNCARCSRRSRCTTSWSANDRPGAFTLRCRTAAVPLDASNLIWQAAAALWKAIGRGGDVSDTRITIDKRIPIEAGLGGGSADAAAALVALARLWGGAPVSLLREVAGTVGADVPFFLSGGTALGLGRGEEIYPLVDLPPHHVAIVRPPFGVSTREAYGWYDEDRAAGLRDIRELQLLPVPWPSRAAQMINDLEPPVVRRHPEINTLKTAAEGIGSGRGRDVGQRLGRFRIVPHEVGGRTGACAALPRRGAGVRDADAEPGRARAAGQARGQTALIA